VLYCTVLVLVLLASTSTVLHRRGGHVGTTAGTGTVLVPSTVRVCGGR
jgi:hypothetical protein